MGTHFLFSVCYFGHVQFSFANNFTKKNCSILTSRIAAKRSTKWRQKEKTRILNKRKVWKFYLYILLLKDINRVMERVFIDWTNRCFYSEITRSYQKSIPIKTKWAMSTKLSENGWTFNESLTIVFIQTPDADGILFYTIHERIKLFLLSLLLFCLIYAARWMVFNDVIARNSSSFFVCISQCGTFLTHRWTVK